MVPVTPNPNPNPNPNFNPNSNPNPNPTTLPPPLPNRYAFLNIPPGALPDECKRGEPAIEFLRDEFKGWSPEVLATLTLS